MWPCECGVCTPPTAVKGPWQGRGLMRQWAFGPFHLWALLRQLSQWWPWGSVRNETEEAYRLWANGGMKSGGFVKFENWESCVIRNWYQKTGYWSLFYWWHGPEHVCADMKLSNGRREGYSASKVTLPSPLLSVSNLPLPLSYEDPCNCI